MNIFSFVKSHVSIVDVVTEYISLKKAGGYLKASCPFHHEKTGSFTVSPHKEIFYCFGCHISGDAISFVAQIENIGQKQAVQLLVERYHIQLPQELDYTSPLEKDVSEKYYEICSLFAQWCHQSLLKSPSILRYCHERDITDTTIKTFSIGYFPSGLATIKRFTQYAAQHNFLLADICDAQIFIQGKNSVYSPFEQRIIFPITNHMGKTSGFGGRVFKSDDTRAKYYNSKEHDLFIKGSLVFGIDQAKKAIQKSNLVFLVEGYTDCIAMAQYGYTNTVATLGTACSIQHLKLLARYARTLCVVYDGDTAGTQAILRIAQLCWQVDVELNVVSLPPEHDPASYLQKYGTLEELIKTAQDIFVYYMTSLGKDFKSIPFHEKVTKVRSFLTSIQGLQDPLKQSMLLTQAAEHFNMPFQALQAERDRLMLPEHKPLEKPAISAHASALPAVSELEKIFFSAIVNDMQLFNVKDTSYIIDHMADPAKTILKKLYLEYNKLEYGKSKTENIQVLLDYLSNTEKEWTIQHMFKNTIDTTTFATVAQQLIRKLWKQIVGRIKQDIAYAKQANNTKKVYQLMQDFLELKKKMIER